MMAATLFETQQRSGLLENLPNIPLQSGEGDGDLTPAVEHEELYYVPIDGRSCEVHA